MTPRINKWIFYATLVAYFFYFLQGSLFEKGDFLSKVPLFAYLMGCAFFTLQSFFLTKLPGFVVLWLLLLFLNIAGYFISPLDNLVYAGEHYLGTVRTIVFVSLSLFPFYYLAKIEVILELEMRILALTLLAVFLLGYFTAKENLVQMRLTREQVNEVYGLVFVVPFVFFFRNNVLKYLFMFVCFAVVVSSFKRGALISISAGISIAIYWSVFKDLTKGNVLRLLLAFIGGIGFVLASYFFISQTETLIQRFERIGRDGGSGRNWVYTRLWEAWLDGTFLEKILGFGYGGTYRIVGMAGHNDLLELLVNFGLFGAALYLCLWQSLFRIIWRFTPNHPEKYAAASILVMWIFDSMYQQWYNSLYASASVMVLGYIIGKYDRPLHSCVDGKHLVDMKLNMRNAAVRLPS
jgi:hypothetical protein